MAIPDIEKLALRFRNMEESGGEERRDDAEENGGVDAPMSGGQTGMASPSQTGACSREMRRGWHRKV